MPLLCIGASRVSGISSAGPAVPSWYSSQPKLRMGIVPGTDEATWAASTTLMPDNFFSYNGMAVDRWNRRLYFLGGGHSSSAWDNAFMVDCTQELCGAVKLSEPSPYPGGDATSNGMANLANGARRGDHNCQITLCPAPGVIRFPAVCAMIGVNTSDAGPSSTATYRLDLGDLDNGRNGYTYEGHVYEGAMPSGLTLVFSVGCVDYRDNSAWCVTQNAFQEPDGIWRVASNGTRTVFGPYSGFLEFPTWCQIIPQFNCLLVGTTANTIKRMDLATGVWSNCTVTGTGVTSYYFSAAYYEPLHQAFGFMGDEEILVLDLPDVANGTYAWHAEAVAVGSVDWPTQTGDEAGHVFTRWNIMPDMGDGTGAIYYAPGKDLGVYYIPLPSERI